MSVVSFANSSSNSAVASLLTGATAVSSSAGLPATEPSVGDGEPSRDPLDNVDLSDRAKATLARARTEQFAADRLTAQLNSGTHSTNARETSDAASYDRVSRSFIALAGISEADLKPAFEQTVPQVTFSSTLQAFGFSVTASGNADSWSSDIQIRGPDGFSAFDTIWGGGKGMPTAGGGGASGGAPGRGFAMSKADGKVTFTIADASASAAAIVTDHGSASMAQAQFNATTFVIDFNTGAISVQRTEMAASSMSVDVAA